MWGAGGVKAGDTLCVSGGTSGKTYSETLIVKASGAAGSPITIRPGADVGHDGKVILDFDSRGDSGTGSGISLDSRNYITIDGSVNGQKNLTIKNLRNILTERAATAIHAESTRGIVLRNLDLSNVNVGVWMPYASEYEVYNNVMQARGDAIINAVASSGTSALNRIHDNHFEILFNTAVPPGASDSYVGPDGVQCSGSISIYHNTFKVTRTSVYTSSQHPDSIQTTGDDVRIYNNEFINIGDSAIDRDVYADDSPNNIWIYNNVFRIVDQLDPYPEYIRLYAQASGGGGSLKSLNNFKVLNNLFIDNVNGYYPIRLNQFFNSGATGSGNEFKNNIFYNLGGAYPVIYIENAPNLQFEFDRNVYYNPGSTPRINYRGTDYSIANWINTFEPSATTAAPQFVSYTAQGASNDLHLKSTDTVARDAGASFGTSFDADKDSVSRPQGVAWDIGPYEYHGSGAVNQPPIVSAGTDLKVHLPTNSVTLNGSAADPEGGSLALNWHQVNGPGTVLFNSPASAVTAAAFPTNLGIYILRLSANDGTNSASADVRVTVNAPVPPAVASFEAESGAITSPFSVAGGAIAQSVETYLVAGGRAVYQFTLPASGTYTISALVNAPSTAADSFYVNVDSEPTDPYMIWDVSPLTSGFESRSVSWRGNGTWDANEFAPKVFTLSAGQHSLIVIGREAHAALDRLEMRSVGTAPSPPTNLRLVNGILSWSAVIGATYRVEYKTNLSQATWAVRGDVTATTATASFTDIPGPGPRCFYRVVSL
jgi:hypothetical protein